MKEFKCDFCGLVFMSEQPEDAAEKELAMNFPEAKNKEECDVACDECYDKIMKEFVCPNN